MNDSAPKEAYGECPVCGEGVKLIYKNPEKKEGMMIGPHHPSLKTCKLEDIGNQNCSGFRHPAKQYLAAEPEPTAQQ